MSFILLQEISSTDPTQAMLFELDVQNFPQAVFAFDVGAQNITVSKLQISLGRESSPSVARVRAFIRQTANDSTYKAAPIHTSYLAITNGADNGWLSTSNYLTNAASAYSYTHVEDFPFANPVTLQAGTRYTIHIEFESIYAGARLKFYGRTVLAPSGYSYKVKPGGAIAGDYGNNYNNVFYLPYMTLIGSDSTSVYELGVLDYNNNSRELSSTSPMVWYPFIPNQSITFNQLTSQFTWYNTNSGTVPGGFGPTVSFQIYNTNLVSGIYTPTGTPLAASNDIYVKANNVRYENATFAKYTDTFVAPLTSSVTLQSGTRYAVLIKFNISNSADRLKIFGNNISNTSSYLSAGNSFSGPTTASSWTPYVDFDSIYQSMSNVALSSSSIQENSALNTVIGLLSTTGGSSPYSYALSGGLADNSAFAISGSNLIVNSPLNYETKSSYSIQVTATDATLATFNKSFTISVTNVNEAPTDITLSNSSVNENQLSGTTVGTLSTIDPDAGNTFTYSLGGTDAASFSITGNTLKTAEVFDRETKSSYSISITSTDQNNLTYTKAFTISVTNVNEAPTDITLSALSIMENNAVNAVIGTLSVTDPDVGDSVAFSVISGGDKFDISGTSLRALVAFNYETAASHSVTVRATDGGGLTYDKAFTISVLNDTGDDNFPLTNANSVTLSGGITVASVDVNPTLIPVLKDGDALPSGSIVRYSVTGQKFIKVDGSNTSYEAIPVTPPANWNWSQELIDAWAVLQNL